MSTDSYPFHTNRTRRRATLLIESSRPTL